MIQPFRLGRRAGEWLRERGPDGDVAISTRIRLARNALGYPFAARLRSREAKKLSEYLRHKVLEACRPQRLQYLNIGGLDPVYRRVLVERHLISREHAHRNESHGVAIGAEEITSIMINEEDHLRLQILRSGLRTRESYRAATRLDQKIGRAVPYARSESFGFLTSCPTNAGTGLRVSAMLHLPALVLGAKIEKCIQEAERKGMEVRGIHGEGSRAYGDLFQFSNRITLGLDEQEIVDLVEQGVRQLIEKERTQREAFTSKGNAALTERIRESISRCSTSSTISSSEAMAVLSLLRMGIHLGLFRQLPIARINELFLWTQPGHLQHLVGRTLGRHERDVIRAQLVRRWCARHLAF